MSSHYHDWVEEGFYDAMKGLLVIFAAFGIGVLVGHFI